MARHDPRARWGIPLGLCFTLAFQTRETSLVPIAVAAIYALIAFPRERIWPLALAAIPAFLLPLGIEFACF